MTVSTRPRFTRHWGSADPLFSLVIFRSEPVARGARLSLRGRLCGLANNRLDCDFCGATPPGDGPRERQSKKIDPRPTSRAPSWATYWFAGPERWPPFRRSFDESRAGGPPAGTVTGRGPAKISAWVRPGAPAQGSNRGSGRRLGLRTRAFFRRGDRRFLSLGTGRRPPRPVPPPAPPVPKTRSRKRRSLSIDGKDYGASSELMEGGPFAPRVRTNRLFVLDPPAWPTRRVFRCPFRGLPAGKLEIPETGNRQVQWAVRPPPRQGGVAKLLLTNFLRLRVCVFANRGLRR